MLLSCYAADSGDHINSDLSLQPAELSGRLAHLSLRSGNLILFNFFRYTLFDYLLNKT